MKKIYLLSIFLLSYLANFAQTLTNTTTTTNSGSTVTFKGSGESSAAYFAAEQGHSVWTDASPNHQYYGNQSIEFVSATYFNKTTKMPTSLAYKLVNTAPVPVTVTYRITVMPYNDDAIKSLPVKTFDFVITVNPAPTIYYNIETYKFFDKNDCPANSGVIGSSVKYTVQARKYTGSTQTEADAKATSDLNTKGQTYANDHGSCEPGYYNEEKSKPFTPNICDGINNYYDGPSFTYTVKAGTYKAATLAQANQLALDDLNGNGQDIANASVGGNACKPYYFSPAFSIPAFRNNCGSGQSTTQVIYTVPTGRFKSKIPYTRGYDHPEMNSIDFNAEAQVYANSVGQCSVPSVIYARAEYLTLYSRGTVVAAVSVRFYSDSQAANLLSINKSMVVNYVVKNDGVNISNSGSVNTVANTSSSTIYPIPENTPDTFKISLLPSNSYQVLPTKAGR